MASYYQRQDSPFFWVRYLRPDGVWKSKSTGIRADSVGALRKVSRLVAEMTKEEESLKHDGPVSLLTNWVPGWIATHYKSEKTAMRYGAAWAWLSLFFKEKDVLHPGEVTARLCHEYMEWRTNPPKGRRKACWNTALCEIRFMGAVMREACFRGLAVSNPCWGLRLARAVPTEKQEISRSHEKIIRDALEHEPVWMRESFEVGIKHGCRLRECAVPMSRIDEENIIRFATKGGREHVVRAHMDVVPIIELARNEGRKVLVEMPMDNCSKVWCKFFSTLGLPYSFHCLRVTVVTRLARAGISESQAMRYVGHSTTLVHALYRKLRPEDLSGAASVL